jgi:hypothetical protein
MATRDTTAGAASATAPPDVPALLEREFGPLIQQGASYPRPLPALLAPWYVYLEDAGHSIVVIPKALWGTLTTPADLLTPAPVKTVLAEVVRWESGWPILDVPYDPHRGLIVPEQDEEW